MSNLICIYHANCADGFGAAWCVRERFGEESVTFIPASYGEAPPDVTGQQVMMVDFSYKRPEMLTLAKQAHHITVIDHHDTAEKELVDLPDNVRCLFDMEHSGAVLTFRELFPDSPLPRFLELIEDRDLWRFEHAVTKPFMAALFSHPMTFSTWDTLMALPVEAHIDEGLALERKQRQDVKAICDSQTHLLIIDGHVVPAVNCLWMHASDVGHQLCNDHPGAPFSVSYRMKGEKVTFSLRSNRGKAAICAYVAAKFGGGGHPPAAGFIGDKAMLDGFAFEEADS